MLRNRIMGLGVGDRWGRRYEGLFKHKRQYLSFTYGQKDNKCVHLLNIWEPTNYWTSQNAQAIHNEKGNYLKRKNYYSLVIKKIYKIINSIILHFITERTSRMHLINEASRLIAVEINLKSNSHYKQNYILLYQDESEQQCLLCGCPHTTADTTLWAERLSDRMQSFISFLLIWMF